MSRTAPPDCLRAQEMMAGVPADPAQALWVAEHREGCGACQRAYKDITWLREGVLETPEVLDDLGRARILARLTPVLDEVTRAATTRPVRRYAVLAVASALAAVSIGIWVPTWIRLVRSSRTAEPQPQLQAGLLPFSVERGAQRWDRLQEVLGRRVRELALPDGVEVRASLGKETTLTLAGPAELEVSDVDARPAKQRSLALRRGRVIARYHGCPGCGLRLNLPGDVAVEVVGTVFLVQVGDDLRPQVAVAQGKVRVHWSQGTTLVQSGQSWSPEGLELLSAWQAQQLRKFQSRTIEEAAPQVAAKADEPGFEESPADPGGPEPAPPLPAPPAKAPPTRLQPQLVTPASRPASAAAALPASVPAPASRPARPAARPAPHPAAPPARATARTPAQAPVVRPPSSPPAALLYSRAEEAMRRKDRFAARELLEQLVSSRPNDPLAAQARYELAHLLVQVGELDRANHHLRALLSTTNTGGLSEPAGYLRCRVLQLRGERAAVPCYQTFRQQHPSSPHDAAALGALILASDCAGSRLLAAEYLTRYPNGRLAAEARRRVKQCGAQSPSTGSTP